MVGKGGESGKKEGGIRIYIYIYTAHVVVSSGAPGTNRMKAGAFVRHNPISLSRKIFFKRRK